MDHQISARQPDQVGKQKKEKRKRTCLKNEGSKRKDKWPDFDRNQKKTMKVTVISIVNRVLGIWPRCLAWKSTRLALLNVMGPSRFFAISTKILVSSGYCIVINFAFIFCTSNHYGCIRSFITQLQIVNICS